MTSEDCIKKNSLRAWFLAARPKTLAGAAVPVMLATAMAFADACGGRVEDAVGRPVYFVISSVLCFLFAFIMQIDANFVNDYFDCVRGNDDETRLGPRRACAMGWITLPAMRIALVVTTLLGCAVGLPLAFIGGWEMVAVGVACVVFCFLYTTTLSYLGLGDVLVLVFFGIVPVCCSYYVETGGMFNLDVLTVSVACGLVIDTLLIINNYRDIDNDRRSGKRTLAVLIGRRAMAAVYLFIVPAALALMLCVEPTLPMAVASAVVILLHFTTWRKMVRIGHGRELNKVLGMTARNIFVYGLLSSAAFILA